MTASPATIAESPKNGADSRAHSSAQTANTAARRSSNPTDDEILGLITNVRRRDLRGVQGQAKAAGEAQDLDQLEPELGLENQQGNGKTSAAPVSAVQKSETENGNELPDPAAVRAKAAVTAAHAAEPAHLQAALEANPELRAAWHEATAYRESFATPQEARAATGMLADLNRMDALFFSRHPEDHAHLARAVAELDPVAFASLARAMTQVAQSACATFPAITARSAAAARSAAPTSARENASASTRFVAASAGDGFVAPALGRASSASPAAQHIMANTVPGASPAQEQFFHSTNAAAVEGVVEAIEGQVERLLPDGISKSARNRVVGEIYRELDSTLRANHTLAQQMRDAFRSGGLDTNHQKAIVSLITGRARQALPGVAKRVLNEWTTTVVSANQQRRERQRTAERRVDIGGAGGAGNEGRHSMGPREINYARMSDADILNL